MIHAIHGDPQRMALSGQVLVGAEAALRYGIADLDGKQPPSYRELLGGRAGASGDRRLRSTHGHSDRQGRARDGCGAGRRRGVAQALAAEGAHVAVVGRTLDKLLATCEAIRARGGVAEPFVCDVMDATQIEQCVDNVVARFGGVQILINNAQVVPLGRLLDVTDASFLAGPNRGRSRRCA